MFEILNNREKICDELLENTNLTSKERKSIEKDKYKIQQQRLYLLTLMATISFRKK
jgi:hypothetical protein